MGHIDRLVAAEAEIKIGDNSPIGEPNDHNDQTFSTSAPAKIRPFKSNPHTSHRLNSRWRFFTLLNIAKSNLTGLIFISRIFRKRRKRRKRLWARSVQQRIKIKKSKKNGKVDYCTYRKKKSESKQLRNNPSNRHPYGARNRKP